MINQDLQQLATLIADQISSQISLQPRWLKLKQAAIYSGIGQKELIKLAKNNIVVGFQDVTLKTTPWIFDKESLDKYRKIQATKAKKTNQNENKIALQIISSINL